MPSAPRPPTSVPMAAARTTGARRRAVTRASAPSMGVFHAHAPAAQGVARLARLALAPATPEPPRLGVARRQHHRHHFNAATDRRLSMFPAVALTRAAAHRVAANKEEQARMA